MVSRCELIICFFLVFTINFIVACLCEVQSSPLLKEQAFIQALLSTAIFFPKIEFFLLFAESVNLWLQIAGKCISDTLFDFKACLVHQWKTPFPREYYGLVIKHTKSHHPNWCIKDGNTTQGCLVGGSY